MPYGGPFYRLIAFGPSDVWAFGLGKCAAVDTGHGWRETTRPLSGGVVWRRFLPG